MDDRIGKLYGSSKEVILSCALENGAIVAANPIKEYYSREAKHYFYVWPRDAAFTCMAAKRIGITNIQEKYFSWIEERAEDMDDEGRLYEKYTGLLYEKYFVNGLQAEHRFQPDQTGAVIFAIADFFDNDPEKGARFRDLAVALADGLCKHWREDHFCMVTNDLWEERHTFPDLRDNFTYSLAACIAGLEAVNKMWPDERYLEVAEQMHHLVIDSSRRNGSFFRSFGLLNDERIDASLSGLVWPFEIIAPDDPVMIKTVDLIIEKLSRNDGIYRYEHDEYDGWMYRGFHRKKGAGTWPLLNFWLSIVLNRMGRREEALKYYYAVIDKIDRNDFLIPEQMFDNDIQKAVSPLCWSHVMFIFATQELGIE